MEAGVRCVTLSYGRWDSHGQNFQLVRDHGGKLDQGVSALIDDLDQRGLLDRTTVVVWGEFGRTPRINPGAGRDHWPQVSCALLAGGGMRSGQVIGATNRLGEFAKERPVHVQEVIATIYHNLGIDPVSTALIDPTGRPQHLVDYGPIKELVWNSRQSGGGIQTRPERNREPRLTLAVSDLRFLLSTGPRDRLKSAIRSRHSCSLKRLRKRSTAGDINETCCPVDFRHGVYRKCFRSCVFR